MLQRNQVHLKLELNKKIITLSLCLSGLEIPLNRILKQAIYPNLNSNKYKFKPLAKERQVEELTKIISEQLVNELATGLNLYLFELRFG